MALNTMSKDWKGDFWVLLWEKNISGRAQGRVKRVCGQAGSGHLPALGYDTNGDADVSEASWKKGQWGRRDKVEQ